MATFPCGIIYMVKNSDSLKDIRDIRNAKCSASSKKSRKTDGYWFFLLYFQEPT